MSYLWRYDIFYNHIINMPYVIFIEIWYILKPYNKYTICSIYGQLGHQKKNRKLSWLTILKPHNIALVSKVSNPSLAYHFWPISLTNTIYKITVEIMANRMSKLMLGLVSSSQAAFIPRRNIIDNIMLARKLMHSLQRAPPSCSLMLLKIDM